ncbi:MAG: phosphinothricin acetyltransferase [Actinomycetota bacterium]|nr:phosphinothricin acetyltransferase [Actinomycetota bacterium]
MTTGEITGVTVREAGEGDWPAVAEIVNHYIAVSTVNFRTAPQTAGEWENHWARHHESHPWLVAVGERATGDAGEAAGGPPDGCAGGIQVLGIAYAGPWSERNAYDWCTEVSVYVRHGAQGRRVGQALYRRLLAAVDAQGFRTQIAVIGLPNDASVGFHESFGFRRAGTLAAVGFKHDTWCDVGYWQRTPVPSPEAPGPLLPCSAVLGD